jgi:aminoglycoside phosphotransferase (APT) family kinase protein
MDNPHTNSQLERIIQKINPHAKLVRTWPLTGGVSAQVTALDIELADGGRQKLIVRQHGDIDRASNPHIAADEFRLLQHLQSAELPVPTPFLVDQSNTILDTPFLVVEYVEGQTDFTPTNLSDFLRQFAATLAKIHQVEAVLETLSFLPTQNDLYTESLKAQPDKLEATTDEGRIRTILALVCPLTQHNPSCLLHGDYWPGNVLWNDGQLVAVIDWEDAAIGDPLADVANSRLEILWAFGVEAMQQFTNIYQSIRQIDLSNLPYWDLHTALLPTEQFADWAAGWIAYGRPDVTGETMLASHQWFVENAIQQIAR